MMPRHANPEGGLRWSSDLLQLFITLTKNKREAERTQKSKFQTHIWIGSLTFIDSPDLTKVS